MICEGVCFVQDDYALQMPCSSKEWFLYIYGRENIIDFETNM